MSFVISVVRKDLTRRLRDPLGVLLWLAVPLLLGVMMTVVVGGDGAPPVAQLLVDDQDRSALSGLLVAPFTQAPQGAFQVTSVEAAQGRQRLEAGEASALLIIPPGFGAAVAQDAPTTLTLVKNPAQQVLPAQIEAALSALVDAAFYGQRIFGQELQAVVAAAGEGGLDDQAVAALDEATQRKVQRLAAYVDPPRLQVDLAFERETDASVSIALLFFPGVLLMGLMFASQGLSEELWRERELGALRRLAGTPQRMTVYLAAKTLSGATLMVAILAALLAVGFVYHGISFWKYLPSLAFLVLAGVDFYLMFLLVALWCPSRRAAGLVGTLLVFPLIMLGGSFFPFEAMPSWMARIGQWTPNGIVLQQFKGYILGVAWPEALVASALVLAGVGVLLFVATAARHQRFVRG